MVTHDRVSSNYESENEKTGRGHVINNPVLRRYRRTFCLSLPVLLLCIGRGKFQRQRKKKISKIYNNSLNSFLEYFGDSERIRSRYGVPKKAYLSLPLTLVRIDCSEIRQSCRKHFTHPKERLFPLVLTLLISNHSTCAQETDQPFQCTFYY